MPNIYSDVQGLTEHIMKNKRFIYGFLLLVTVIGLFASCKQDVIFYDIAQEVEYEAPIVEGNIFSMVPCNGMLFVQNNNIYQKGWTAEKNAEGKWTQLSTAPASGKPVVRLASDAAYLYALVKDNALDTTGSVYVASVTASGVGSWTTEPVAENVKELYDNCVFAADGTTTGRNAYITDSDNAVKKLDGTGTPAAQTVTDQIGSTATTDFIKTAASDGTTDYFSSNPAFAVVRKSSDTYIYTSFDGNTASASPTKTLKYKKIGGTGAWSSGGTTNANITVLTANGEDQLLIGTYTGYETSAIGSDGKPANVVTPSGSNDNAESAFGTRYITGIWHYGAEGTLYAAVIGVEHSQYNKLWGYYTSRNKWNYE